MPLIRMAERHRIAFSFGVVVLVAALIVAAAVSTLSAHAVDGKARRLAAENRVQIGRISDLQAQILKIAREGKEAHDAICVLKADFSRRIADSEEFLREHPDGVPGIPASTIRNSLKNTKATVKALGVLACPSDT